MQAGKLKHYITIQKAVVLRNTYGEAEQTWEDLTNASAKIEPLMGREYFYAQQTQSKVDYKLTIRYQSGIKPYYRAIWGVRIFNIRSLLNVLEENRELILYCEEQIE